MLLDALQNMALGCGYVNVEVLPHYAAEKVPRSRTHVSSQNNHFLQISKKAYIIEEAISNSKYTKLSAIEDHGSRDGYMSL